MPSRKRERAVVLDQAFERLPGEVESVESGIAPLERGDHPQRLRIVVEAAAGGEAAIERALAGMAERRMAEVVGERQRLGQILVEPERASERACDLRDLERMGQAGAEMVALVEDEDLGLVGEPPEGGRMDDAVAVAAEGVAGRARRLRMEPAAAPARSGRIGGAREQPLQPPWPDRPIDQSLRAHLTIGQARWQSLVCGWTHMYDVTVTERAARRIGEILRGEPPGAMLRVSVEGGGCSGFQYKFDIDRAKAADDVVIARDGATVLIDPVSVGYLAGSEIDFVDDLIGASFRINNPKATASCGCGTSFSL